MEIVLKPNEKQMEILTTVSEITGVDYDGKDWHEDITVESLFDALADMIVYYHGKEEELEDHIKHCKMYHILDPSERDYEEF